MARKMNDMIYFRALRRLSDRIEYWKLNEERYRKLFDTEKDEMLRKEYFCQIERAVNELARAVERKAELYLAQQRDNSPRIEFDRVPMDLDEWLSQRTYRIGKRWGR